MMVQDVIVVFLQGALILGHMAERQATEQATVLFRKNVTQGRSFSFRVELESSLT